jgi:hypothetical protein
MSGPFSERNAHCQVTLDNGGIAVIGGDGKRDVWSSPDRGSSWRRVCEEAPWAARGYFGSCFVRGNLVVFGGGHGPFDAWESPDRGSSWERLPATGITGMMCAFGFCANRDGSIFVIGGSDGSRSKAEVHRSDDGGRSWRLVHSGGSWSAREGLSAVCMPSGELVLMGGYDDSSELLNDVWVSADGGSGWSLACASATWSARSGHQSVCTADGAIVLLGGAEGSGSCNDVWSSRDAGRTWMCVVSAAPWAGRTCFGASAVGEPMPDSCRRGD